MNDFDWQDGRPSIFLQDPWFNKAAKNGLIATQAIAKARAENRDVSTLYGLSRRSDELVYTFKLSFNTPIMSKEESDRTQSIRNST